MGYVDQLFDIFAVGLFGAIVGVMLMNTALKKSLRVSAVDGMIIAYVTWCVAIYLIYFETANIETLAKIAIPMLCYTLVKNVIADCHEYRRFLVWILVGFSIPTIASATLIAAGHQEAIETVRYWTDLPRWQGVYTGSHNLGHSMTLFLMTIALYIVLRKGADAERVGPPRRGENIILAGIAGLALYCLYMSQVRSALLGLLTFAAICLYFYNKKLLVLGGSALAVLAVLTVPHWLPRLVPELAVEERSVALINMGSGRPRMWLNDITVYAQLPIDQKLAGVGIGAGVAAESKLAGHNDWLETLTGTGLIGLILFSLVQIFIFKAILRMPGKERPVFLALFAAVIIMMAVSNSYVLRIAVSQLYYMILAFIELRPSQPTVLASADSVRVAKAPNASRSGHPLDQG